MHATPFGINPATLNAPPCRWADTNALLVECGVPPQPAGRVWLLKAPTSVGSVDAVLERLVSAASADEVEIMAPREFVKHAAVELPKLFGPSG